MEYSYTEMAIAYAYTCILNDAVKKIDTSEMENKIEGIVYYDYEEVSADIIACSLEEASKDNTGFSDDAFRSLCNIYDETRNKMDQIAKKINYDQLEAIIKEALTRFKFTAVEFKVCHNSKIVNSTVYDGHKLTRSLVTTPDALHNLYICAKW